MASGSQDRGEVTHPLDIVIQDNVAELNPAMCGEWIEGNADYELRIDAETPTGATEGKRLGKTIVPAMHEQPRARESPRCP